MPQVTVSNSIAFIVLIAAVALAVTNSGPLVLLACIGGLAVAKLIP